MASRTRTIPTKGVSTEEEVEVAESAMVGAPPGVSGVPYFGRRGRVDDELLTQLRGQRWFRIVRQMDENDSTIGAARRHRVGTLRRVPFYFEPQNGLEGTTVHGWTAEDVAERFNDMLFKDLSRGSWDDVFSDALTMEPFGLAVFTYGLKVCRGESADPLESSLFSDGFVGIRELRFIRQETIDEWLWRSDGTVHGFIQVAHPNFTPTPISLQQCVHIRTESNRGNPEGRSAYRNAYRAWFFLTRLEELEATAVERQAVGLPVIEMPAKYLDLNTRDQNLIRTRARWRTVLQQLRRNQREGIQMPASEEGDKKTGWKLRLLGIEGGAGLINVREIIRGKQLEIAQVLGASFLATGKGGNAGAKAQHVDESDQAEWGLTSALDTIADAFQPLWQLIGRLNGIPPEFVPRFTHGPVGRKAAARYADTLVKLLAAGALTADEGLEDYLRREFELPELTDDAREALDVEAVDDDEADDAIPGLDDEDPDDRTDPEPRDKGRGRQKLLGPGTGSGPILHVPPPAVRAAAHKALERARAAPEVLSSAALRRAKGIAAGHPQSASALKRLHMELQHGPDKGPGWNRKNAAWARWHALGGDAGAEWTAAVLGD